MRESDSRSSRPQRVLHERTLNQVYLLANFRLTAHLREALPGLELTANPAAGEVLIVTYLGDRSSYYESSMNSTDDRPRFEIANDNCHRRTTAPASIGAHV